MVIATLRNKQGDRHMPQTERGYDINKDPYFGTADIHCLLIQPHAATITQHTVHRTALADFVDQHVPDAVVYPLSPKGSYSIFDLHILLHTKAPAADTAQFWLQTNGYSPGIAFKGNAIIIARSPDERRFASNRIELDRITSFVTFTEPPVAAQSLTLTRMLKPLREAGAELRDAIAQIDPLDTGYVEVGQHQSRTLLAVLEILAHDFEVNVDPPYEQYHATFFFTETYRRLVEHGYLNPDMCSARLRHWIEVYS
jgi:hypothetical protein